MSTPPPPEGGFGPMGGTPGDGFLNDPGQGNMNSGVNGNNLNPGGVGSGVYGQAPPQQPQFRGNTSQTPTHGSYGNPPPSTPSVVGSITQYASPEMSSGLPQQGMQHPGMLQAGMQQPGMQQPGMQQPGMQQPGIQQPGMQQPGVQRPGIQQPGMQQPNYGGSSIQGGAAPAPGSFAARSVAMMQQQQQQAQSMQPQLGFGQNQQQRQPYQHPTHGQPPMPPVQSPPTAPGPQYRPMAPQQQQSQAPPGSFAARSQAMASQAQAQQQTMMQQGMQQPGIIQQYQQQQQPQYGQQPASHVPSTAPQAPPMASYSVAGSSVVTGATAATATGKPQPSWAETPAQVAVQNRLLTDATRKVQEHAYYMRQAIEKNDLPNAMDRASLMVGQLGENHAPSHLGQAGHPGPNAPPPGGEASQLNPKNYYELHMRALEDMPNFEEYLLSVSGHGPKEEPVDPNRITITAAPTPSPDETKFTTRELYDCVQYCPQVLPRLYLQICAGSALIQSGEVGTKWVMNDLMQATKCVQNPVRGLFLRHYLLQMLRDKLPDSSPDSTPLAGPGSADAGDNNEAKESTDPEQEAGTVVDSYQFILANFIEMNKLWVRIQHLAGDGKSKDQRKRRERQRNELRILVGTNLVRLSQLEGVTSKIYGETILPTVLDHITVSGDPLAQAYLIDCLTQVFPDEYHIETLPILLRVCPRLRDKVNIRTILQNLMDRLANYLADEELLDETDTNQVKMNMAQDSFPMFEECVQNVYNARGPKLNAKEVVRLQTALLSFSLRCFHGDMAQVNRCLQGCVAGLRQSNASYEMQEGTMAEVPGSMKPLDDVATAELEKLLSIPLDSLALKVLQLPNYGELLSFLPWNHRREVALKLLKAVDDAGKPPTSVKEIEELFGMVEPVIRDEHDMSQMMSGMQQVGLTSMNDQPSLKQVQQENALVSKLVHLLDHDDTDVVYEMLVVARQHINKGASNRTGQTLVAVVFATFRVAQLVYDGEHGTKEETPEKESSTIATEEKAEGKTDAPAPAGSNETDGAPAPADAVPPPEEKEETAGEDSVPPTTADEPESTTPAANGEISTPAPAPAPTPFPISKSEKSVSCRKLFVFLQQTIAMVASSNVEAAFKLYLQAALTADRFAGSRKAASETLDAYGPMPYEFITQSFVLYEQGITDSKMQHRCIVCTMGTLLDCQSLSDEDYEGLITKTAQFSAKTLKKSDQCQLVAQCAHLFYPTQHQHLTYGNAQRALECLQRALKLADVCVSADSSEIHLFVDLLDHYLHFFEKKCPVISDAYVTGLAALIKEHITNLSSGAMGVVSPSITNARDQFGEIVRSIKEKKVGAETAAHFAPINV